MDPPTTAQQVPYVVSSKAPTTAQQVPYVVNGNAPPVPIFVRKDYRDRIYCIEGAKNCIEYKLRTMFWFPPFNCIFKMQPTPDQRNVYFADTLKNLELEGFCKGLDKGESGYEDLEAKYKAKVEDAKKRKMMEEAGENEEEEKGETEALFDEILIVIAKAAARRADFSPPVSEVKTEPVVAVGVKRERDEQ